MDPIYFKLSNFEQRRVVLKFVQICSCTTSTTLNVQKPKHLVVEPVVRAPDFVVLKLRIDGIRARWIRIFAGFPWDNSKFENSTEKTAQGLLDFNPSYESPSRSQPIYSGEFVANIPASIALIHQSASSTAHQQSRGSVGVALQTDYADDLVAKSLEHQIVVQRPEDMFTPDPSPEKSSRKRKPESRLYNFLHPSRSRSRSGSRSRGGARSPTPPIPDEPLPQHPRSLSFGEAERPTSSVMSTPSSAKTARAGAKPTSRIPSRPLSSTTTATNTTITPRTPTQTKPKSRIFDNNTNGRRENPPTQRSSSPKPSAARQKLHNFFGLPLRGRKPVVDSRASSPGPSGRGHEPSDLPPSPPRPSTATTHIQRMEYKPSQSTTSSHSQSWATTSNSHSRNASEDSVPKRSNSGSRLVRLFSGRSSSRSNAQAVKNQDIGSSVSLSISPPVVSGPLSSKSKTHRRSGLGGSLDTATSRGLPSDPSSLLNPKGKASAHQTPLTQGYGSEAAGVPRITTTPATPVKSGTSPSRIPARRLEPIESEGWQPMAMVDEEGRVVSGSVTEALSSDRRRVHGNGKERDKRRPDSSNTNANQSHARGFGPPKTRLTSRGTKHGSFDFERPGWSGVASGKASTMARSVSGGSTSGGSALTSRTGGSGVNQSRESVAGNGIGRTSRKGSAEMPPILRPHDYDAAGYRRTTPIEPDHTGSSTHTSASGATGLTSSFGRSSGRKVIGGVSKLFGGGHGPFPFEPPVPSPAMSTGSTNPSPSSAEGFARQQDQRLLSRGRAEEPSEGRSRTKFASRATGRDKPAVPVPIPPPPNSSTKASAGYRSGTKGRSLDLNLGLSWAPNKVREEALLPFGRSLSISRRAEHTRGHAGDDRQHRLDADLAKIGRDIAEIFRNVLDEEGYAEFRKYVHRFDAHEIPFDGSKGIVTHVERLLARSPHLDSSGKKRLLDSFVKIILQNA
ncbi:hypothetical protein EYR36_006469 [Pleurotus pulmonarius]|nr:hypothetical protein EYR36_006469 [Pleurotus pulmonarius]